MKTIIALLGHIEKKDETILAEVKEQRKLHERVVASRLHVMISHEAEKIMHKSNDTTKALYELFARGTEKYADFVSKVIDFDLSKMKAAIDKAMKMVMNERCLTRRGKLAMQSVVAKNETIAKLYVNRSPGGRVALCEDEVTALGRVEWFLGDGLGDAQVKVEEGGPGENDQERDVSDDVQMAESDGVIIKAEN